jgi:hypothetical protein
MKRDPELEELRNNSFASDTLGARLSTKKAKFMWPELFNFWGNPKKVEEGDLDILKAFDECLQFTDSNAAMVISINPLRIACFSDEMDGITMLEMPQRFVAKYDLKVQTRLICINTYRSTGEFESDILHRNPRGVWDDVGSTVADFITDDINQLNRRKSEISAEQWELIYVLGTLYYKILPELCREHKDNGMTSRMSISKPFKWSKEGHIYNFYQGDLLYVSYDREANKMIKPN